MGGKVEIHATGRKDSDNQIYANRCLTSFSASRLDACLAIMVCRVTRSVKSQERPVRNARHELVAFL
jgi:hypothetical protein